MKERQKCFQINAVSGLKIPVDKSLGTKWNPLTMVGRKQFVHRDAALLE